ncbi:MULTISPECIES: DUF998 domain-containing protein [Shewanella]|uniref:DUF998 domain-containing protein n=1 Tax=Shewanella sedimentimangrovi TaxID=2814293 RepID=A0ABX7QYJ3_9GAMM|nr:MULTISPECIES: hypothetical protein [Shewanella]QSX36519.1 hypothetical protein JYB85_14690 [Shewanella sedimentimangrovi]QSX40122.1 hypothetical protein JYB84_14245 [Shewanella cyperi]
MADEERTGYGQYDPHRLVFHMSIGGVSICALGMFIALFGVFQQQGWETLNLRVDRLGDYLSSPMAYVYNISLLFAGVSFITAMLGLYNLRYNEFSRYLAIVGACAGLGIMLIGIYPYNDAMPHRLVSLFFVLSSLAMFVLLILTRINHKHLCNLPLFYVAIVGLLATLTLLAQIDPATFDYRPCPVGQNPCFLALSLWLHTAMTMLAGLGLALVARHLVHMAITARESQ